MPSPRPKRNVLIAEDEYLLADNLLMLLRSAGYGVVGPAFSVAEAMSLLESSHHLDAAVVDLELKGELSLPVIDALRARRLPVFLMTGHMLADLPPEYRDVPIWQKPMLAIDIVGRLNRLFARE